MKVNSRPAAVPGNQRRPRGREAGVEERPVQVQDMWIREAARPQRLPGEEDEDCRWPADSNQRRPRGREAGVERNGQFKCKTCGSEKPHGRKGCPGKKMKIAAGQQTLT